MQEMEQRVNVQLVEQHPHYYQGATISEIEDSEATGSTAVASMASVNAAAAATASAPTVVRASGKQEQAFTSPGISSSSVSALASASVAASAQVQQFHPQAVQASPVLVLHDDQRHRLRQKALVDSVESKV